MVLTGAAWLLVSTLFLLSHPSRVEAVDVATPGAPTVVGGYAEAPQGFLFRVRISTIAWTLGRDPDPSYAILLTAAAVPSPFDQCLQGPACYLQGNGQVGSTPVWLTFNDWNEASRNLLRGIPLEHRGSAFYAFKVQARQTGRDDSARSDPGTGRVPPGPAQSFAPAEGGDWVQLQWTPPVTGAQGYTIFRSLTGPSQFDPVGTMTLPAFTDRTIRSRGPQQVSGVQVVSSGTALGLQWNVPPVDPVTGYYRVQGYLISGPEGPELGEPTQTLTVPFRARVSSYTVRAVPEEGERSGETFTFAAATASVVVPSTLTSNTRHAFQVQGITQDGVTGPFSDAVHAHTVLRVAGVRFPEVEPTHLRTETSLDNPRFREGPSQAAARMGYAPVSGGAVTWCSTDGDGWVTDTPVRCDLRSLAVSTAYRFTIETRNFAGVVGSSVTVKSTKAVVPPQPTPLNVGPGRIRIAVAPGSNPQDARTEFVMFAEGGSGGRGYVQLNTSEEGGERGRLAPAESWGGFLSPAGWGGSDGLTVIGLETGMTYSFKVKARNQDREATEFGPPIEITLREGGAQAPGVERVVPPVLPNQWVNQTTFTFTLKGQPNQLRVRWDQEAQGRVVPSDDLWTGAGLTKRAAAEGAWYLHLLGPDPSVGRDVQADFGPILVDITPPIIPRVAAKFGPEEDEPIPDQDTSYNPNPYFFWPTPPSASPIEGYCYQMLGEPQDRELSCSTVQVQASTITIPGVRITNLASGRYRFRVKAKNLAGNWSPTSAVFTLNLTRDDDPATVTFQPPQTAIGEFLFGTQLQPPIRFIFNDHMATTTFPRGITLRRIWRHDGLPGTEVIPLTFEATVSGGQTQLTATPQTPLPQGSVFLLQATPAVKDKGGNPIAPFSVHFRSRLDRTQRNTVFRAAQPETRVMIPQNLLPEESFVIVDLDPLASAPEMARRAVTEANAKLQSEGRFTFILPDSIRAFELRDGANRPISTDFTEDVQISLGYQDAGQGLIAGAPVPIRAKSLTVAFLDERQGRWVSLKTQVDLTANTAQAFTRHFSIYSVIANPDYSLADVIVYPIPFAPNSGDPNQGTTASGITFGNLSTQATIKIYTLSGELVRTLEHTTGLSTLQWDTANDQGEKVFSGVYLFLAQNAREKKTGKLVIIR